MDRFTDNMLDAFNMAQNSLDKIRQHETAALTIMAFCRAKDDRVKLMAGSFGSNDALVKLVYEYLSNWPEEMQRNLTTLLMLKQMPYLPLRTEESNEAED